MNKIKTQFTINDLENITGVKAHTIRIWEKRYNILTPVRSSRDIRNYNLQSLQKLLNVQFLNSQGVKISKIALLSEKEITTKVNLLIDAKYIQEAFIKDLKIAMYNFDSSLFEKIFLSCVHNNSFASVFKEVFIPFLEFLGYMWQCDAITPAHEHFITNLLYQKIQGAIEKLPLKKPKNKELFVLFLPEEEMHEIGLLYLNYELARQGYRTIYLGRCIPLNSLHALTEQFSKIHFVAYVTLLMEQQQLKKYALQISNMLSKTSHIFSFIGKGIQQQSIRQNKQISYYISSTDFLKEI